MSQITQTHNNFTSGELAPDSQGRVDVDQYKAGAKEILNFQPTLTGGVERRVGTFQYFSDFDATYPAHRQIPFVFSNEASYIICISHESEDWTVFDASGTYVATINTSPLFVETSLTESIINGIRFAQSYDTMILTSLYFYPKKIVRNSEASWAITDLLFEVPPTAEGDGDTNQTNISIFSDTLHTTRTTAVGTVYTTCTSGQIYDGDVGRTITQYYPNTDLVLLGVDTATDIVTFDASIPPFSQIVFTGSDIPAPLVAGTLYWTDSSNNTTTKISTSLANAHSGTGINLTTIGSGLIAATIQSGGEAQIKTTSYPDLVSMDITTEMTTDVLTTGYYKISGTPSINIKLTAYDYGDDFHASQNRAGRTTVLSASGRAFRSTDVGKFIVVSDGGVFEIVSFLSWTTVRVKIHTAQAEGTVKASGTWTLEEKLWYKTTDTGYNAIDDAESYPLACAFYDQRFYLASWSASPQGIVGSKTGDYFNFSRGEEDDESFNITATCSQRIQHLVPISPLLILTSDSEMTLDGSADTGITPTTLSIQTKSHYGSSNISPAIISGSVCYASASKRKIFITSYSKDTGQYNVTDALKLARHITKTAYITSITAQAEPYPIITITLSDGTLASCIYSADDSVLGWARHKLANSAGSSNVTDMAFAKNVCSIPNGNDTTTFVLGYLDDNIVTLLGIDYSGRVGSSTNHMCFTDFSTKLNAGTYQTRQELSDQVYSSDGYDSYANETVLYMPLQQSFTSSYAYLIDETGNSKITSNLTATIDNTHQLYGEATLKAYGPIGAYDNSLSDCYKITPSDSSLFDFTNNRDMTLECMVYLDDPIFNPAWDLTRKFISLFQDGNAQNTPPDKNCSWRYSASTGVNQLLLEMGNAAGNGNISSLAINYTLATGQWYHLAVVRSATLDPSFPSGHNCVMYVNGVSIGSGTVSDAGAGTYHTAAVKTFMSRQINTSLYIIAILNGSTAQYRITAAPRYTTPTFTAPTAPPITTPNPSSSAPAILSDDNAVLYVANTFIGKLGDLIYPLSLDVEGIIGYNYLSSIDLLTPNADVGTGSSALSHLHSNLLGFRVYDSMDFKVNGDYLPRNVTNIPYGFPNQAVTGDYRIENYGWARGSHALTITQDQPVPTSISAIFMRLTVNQ